MVTGKVTTAASNQRPNHVQQAAGACDFVVLHTDSSQEIRCSV